MRPGESYLPVQMLCFPGSSAGKEFTCDAADPSSIPGSRRSSEKAVGYPLQYSWASLVAQLVKNLPVMRRPGFDPWVGKIPWRREWLPTPVFLPVEFHGLHSPWGHKDSDTLTFQMLCLQWRHHAPGGGSVHWRCFLVVRPVDTLWGSFSSSFQV